MIKTFLHLDKTVGDYTAGTLDGYDEDDIAGLLTDRLVLAKENLDTSLEAVKALCEPVKQPKETQDYIRYFVVTRPSLMI